MDAVEVLRKYQARATDGSVLPETRTNRDYAALIGVHESYLSKCYDGLIPVGWKAMQGLARAFPSAAAEVVAIILAGPPEGLPEDREAETVAVAS